MSRHRLAPRIFDPKQPLFARKELRLSGRTFAVGRTVRWQSLGYSQRKMRTLYENGFVTHEDPLAGVVAPVEPVPPQEPAVADTPAEDFDMTLDAPQSVDQDLLDIDKLKDLHKVVDDMAMEGVEVEKVRAKNEQRDLIQAARNAAG